MGVMRYRSIAGCALLAIAVWLLWVAPVRAAESVRVLIAYSSQTGNTERMANAAAEGVREVEAAATVRRISKVTKEDLENADGVMLGSPVHMGDVSSEMRQSLVAWSQDFGFWESRALRDKVGAVFATGGAPSNGKEFTMMSMALTLLQFGMVLVSPYGGLGASATTAIPETDRGVDERELSEARELGKRVAVVAARMKRGR